MADKLSEKAGELASLLEETSSNLIQLQKDLEELKNILLGVGE